MEVEEIVPIQYHGSTAQVLTYKRVQVEKLSKEYLETLYELSNSKEKIAVLQTDRFFYIQYPGKPVILLERLSGRLFWLGDTNKALAQHQATFVLRILNHYGLVEELEFHKVVVKK